MEIRCACGNGFFVKQIKLNKLLGQEEIHEEIYYACSVCGFTIAKKDLKSFPVTKDGDRNVIILFREIE